jgi:4-hydroxy-tetrahydrodipicolinate reductase
MKVALIGYGTMGHEIERVLIERGHKVELVIDVDNQNLMTVENLQKVDVAIEFTTPTTAYNNIMFCLKSGIPIVSGSTGWSNQLNEAKRYCEQVGGTLFYSSNFSIGVNIMFWINKLLAKMMNSFSEYDVSVREVHHTRKIDRPSGTAEILANAIVDMLDNKSGYINELTSEKQLVGVESIREGDVVGIHTVKYESDADVLEIQHIAKNRSGLALGAVLAAEYALTHKGVLTMEEMMCF